MDDGDGGGGEDDALDLGAVLLSGLQDADSTVDCGASNLGGVLPLPDDRGSGVDDTIDILDGLVVGTFGLNVGDDDGGHLAGVLGESVDDEFALGGGSNTGNREGIG